MVKTSRPKTKPDKALMERLETQGFIEQPTSPKAPTRKPLLSKIQSGDKTTAEIITEGRLRAME